MENWPTAQAIDDRIALSNQVNGRKSALTGTGKTIIKVGAELGVNPGVVTAIMQRECQLGADGSKLPTEFNNFAGITGSGDAGTRFFIDRNWAVYSSMQEGLRAPFALLSSPLYRNTGGMLADVMDLYSPADDGNPRPELWAIFHAVAAQLGIRLEPDTDIYAAGPTGEVPANDGSEAAAVDILDEVVNNYTGVAYAWGGIPQAWQDPWETGWDCSGMTYWVNQKYGDAELVMGSHYQYRQMDQTSQLFTDQNALHRGDLIFFDTGWYGGAGGNLNPAGHVGLFLGGDRFFHAANTTVNTLVSGFSGYWASLFIGGAHTSLPTQPRYARRKKIMDGARAWTGAYDLITNNSVYYGQRQSVEIAVDDVRRRNFALTTAPETGSPLKAGDKFNAIGFVVGKEALNPPQWWIWSGGTKERPVEIDPATRPLSGFDRIGDAGVYHAADPASGKPVTVTAARDGGKVCRFPTLNSPPSRPEALKKGERLDVVEFIAAETVGDEPWWWRTPQGDHINAGETVEKPYVKGMS